jgi:HAD superfamily hydrolase (TIGR01490 family)
VGTSVESSSGTAAAFFDLDKTLISRSSTLAFVPSFYRRGLITRTQALRGIWAQLTFRLAGAGPGQMERIRDQVSALCQGWNADLISEIVTGNLAQVIEPLVYAEGRSLMARHRRDGHDVLIASTSGQEIVRPIADLLGVGASATVATRLEITDGHYTGSVEYYAYGQAKADGVAELAAERGYRLGDCYAYSDSVTDLPLLELVGHPYVVNPDRALGRVARRRGWPILSFSQCGTRSQPHPPGKAGTARRQTDTGGQPNGAASPPAGSRLAGVTRAAALAGQPRLTWEPASGGPDGTNAPSSLESDPTAPGM